MFVCNAIHVKTSQSPVSRRRTVRRVQLELSFGVVADIATTTDEIDIDAGECECSTVNITWNGDRFDRFN
jgi:hypothetical protein